MIEYTDFLPTNYQVPRECFFPGNWQGKTAWTNGHIATTLLPDGVDKDYPDMEALSSDEYHNDEYKVIRGYKKPADIDKVDHEKKIKINYSYSEYRNSREHRITLKNGSASVVIDSLYYQMVIGMYGFNLDFYLGADGFHAVSVYKDEKLVALIMPLRK